MNDFITETTAERWVYEDEQYLAEVRELAKREAMEHPTFGSILCELLDIHNLLDGDGLWLSDSAEAFVTVFFEVLGQCLDEHENRQSSVG